MNREITLTRTLDAPRQLVFQAWTDPSHLGWFFNPDFPVDIAPTVDLVPGGAWRQHMIVNDELEYVTGGIYREIVAPERIVIAWGAVGGWPEIDPDDLDAGPVLTITLVEIDADTTELTLHAVIPEKHWHPHMRDGWNLTIDRLAAQLG